MFDIQPVNKQFSAKVQEKIDQKTKPLGALGELELLAKKIAEIQFQDLNDDSDVADLKIALRQPHLSVFAGDHGVAAQGVSIAPSEVTGQMVANFAQGGAAINVFCRQFGWQLSVIDAGIVKPVIESKAIVNQRLGNITQPINQQAAMTLTQVEQGFEFAKQHISSIHNTGCNIIAFGEMGIGNTTIASAIMAALMNIPASEAVGHGTGVSCDVVAKKQQVVEQALTLHANNLDNAMEILRCLGGFEIAQITAAMLSAAEHKMIIVVDGFICTAAAMLAISINKNVKDYLVFSHCSGEQGHEKMLSWLGVKAVLNLGLRLGEGTGAALTLPLLQAAVAFYNDMASFSNTEVTDVT
jgi:nicotinate-nucleotide--dimethylbenzimidazole phosphoribosyltransferase